MEACMWPAKLLHSQFSFNNPWQQKRVQRQNASKDMESGGNCIEMSKERRQCWSIQSKAQQLSVWDDIGGSHGVKGRAHLLPRPNVADTLEGIGRKIQGPWSS